MAEMFEQTAAKLRKGEPGLASQLDTNGTNKACLVQLASMKADIQNYETFTEQLDHVINEFIESTKIITYETLNEMDVDDETREKVLKLLESQINLLTSAIQAVHGKTAEIDKHVMQVLSEAP